MDLMDAVDWIRKAPTKYLEPRTGKLKEVQGYKRVEPLGREWCAAANVDPDVGALARMVASEVGRLPPQYMIAVVECVLNECAVKKMTPFARITMEGLILKGGRQPKSAGYFGQQSGRWCSSAQDPTQKHLRAVNLALQWSPERKVAQDARRWADLKVMRKGMQGGKPLKYDDIGLANKWMDEGWAWIGQTYEPDGKTLLIDPYILTLWRLAGRGKVKNRKETLDMIADGRKRWKVKL